MDMYDDVWSERKNSTIGNIIIILALFLLFGGYYPFETNTVIFGTQGYNLARLMSLLLICCGAIIKKGKIVIASKNFSLIMLMQFIFFLVWGFIINSIVIIANCVMLIVAYTTVVVVINIIDFRKVLLFFGRFTLFSGIMTTIGVVLFSLGMLDVISIFNKGETLIQNFGFFFVKIYHENEGMLLNVRPAGYFDEPGSFAYMAMLLLLVNKLYFDNRKLELGLIIFPLITTSMAHIFSVVIYLFLFYFKIKNLHKFIITVGSVILILSVMTSIAKTNETFNFFYNRTVERVELFLSGEGGNSRASGFEMGPNLVAKYPTGVSPEYIQKSQPSFSHESIYSIPLFYGFQGMVFYFLPFIYVLFLIFNSTGEIRNFYIKAFLLWTINLLQRPFYIQPFYIFTMYFLFFNTINVLPLYKGKLTR